MPLVRVPEREYGAIGRLLDGGAHGIVAPRIETADEAETVGPRLPLPTARPALAGRERAHAGHATDPGRRAQPDARRDDDRADPRGDPARASPTPTPSPRSTAST